MGTLSSLRSIWLWLALAAVAAAQINYPATIEVDLLFPRNETYKRNITTIPIVFAIQNAHAAYEAEWRINWNISSASSDSSDISGSHFSTESFSTLLPTRINDFRYYFNDDVAIVPISSSSQVAATLIPIGAYRLDWEYVVDKCFPEGESAVYPPMPRVATGSHYFSIVEHDDDSGSDFDIPLDECPLYGDMWTKASSSSECPLTSDSQDVERDPCAAQLQTAGQMDCLIDYFFERKNDTESCLSAFQKVTESWIESDSSDGDGDDDDDDDDADSSDESDSGDYYGAAVSLRPGVFSLAVTVLVVMVLC